MTRSMLPFLGISLLLIASSKSAFDNSVYLDEENVFKLYWSYNASSDVVLFCVEVQTLGWVGFGFAHTIYKMESYDVVVGKIQDGRGSLTDRYTDGYKEPLADASQDYKLTDFSEHNGKTVLKFYRKRSTGDTKDIEIKPGPMLAVYAYHRLDYPSPYKTKHEKQGWKEVTFIQLSNEESHISVTEIKSQMTPSKVSMTTSVNASYSVVRQMAGPVVRSVQSSSSSVRCNILVTLVFALLSATPDGSKSCWGLGEIYL